MCWGFNFTKKTQPLKLWSWNCDFHNKVCLQKKKQDEDENLTSQEEVCLRWREFVFAKKKKETKPSQDEDLTSLDILELEKKRSKNRLSPRYEDIKKVEDQKLKSEILDRKKDHFALVVVKGCNYLSHE